MHFCQQCGQPIRWTEERRTAIARDGLDLPFAFEHGDCQDAAGAFAEAHGYAAPRRVWFLGDVFDPANVAWVQGHFPIVAARMGWVGSFVDDRVLA